MSKVVLPVDNVTFSAADFFGTWRIYVQRVEAKLSGSTIQIGQVTFGPTGAVLSGALTDAAVPPVTTTLTATGSSVAITSVNGSVSGTFLAAGTAATADRYTILGAMRPSKDLITGVLTGSLTNRTTTHYGVVTLVRDVTVLDLDKSAYSVVEGGALPITVRRTGNMAGTATANYTITGATGSLATPLTGPLSFGAGATTAMFMVGTIPNALVDGNRSVTLTLGNVSGNTVLGAGASAPLTIVDDDKAGRFRLSAPTYLVAESGKNAPVTIQRVAGSGAAAGIVVSFALSDGTALASRGDYIVPVNSSVTFSAADSAKTVLVAIPENTLVDGPRAFTFMLTGASGGGVIDTPASAIVTIGDNDTGGTLQFSAATYSVLEGNTSTIMVVRGPGAPAACWWTSPPPTARPGPATTTRRPAGR